MLLPRVITALVLLGLLLPSLFASSPVPFAALTLILIGALTYVPALALGPVVEQLQMIGAR